ncbi:MAG: hypothetical protein LQ343_005121 [Gyalolechia ehrenbergii]|nr:MAG: hypothetical protein LQ343_005121 [Gyalolechia ehrenbergii]
MASTQKEYKVTLKNATFFANLLYGLSNVRHASSVGSKSEEYLNASDSVRKQVTLLDGISLLLVFRASGDVAATGMLQEGNQVTIYWAKNVRTPLTNEERQYVEALERCFRTSESAFHPIELVIPMCRRKILSRIKKLVKVLDMESTNVFGLLSSSDRHTEDFRKYLVRKRIIRDAPLFEALDRLAKAAADLTDNSSTRDVRRVVVFASYLTGPGMNLGGVPGVNPYLFHRLRKVGDYHSACVQIVNTLAKLSPAIRQNFSLQQLTPPAMKSITVYGDTIRALNTFSVHYDVTPIASFQDLQQAYKYASPAVPQSNEIKSTQHCELTVALTLWQKKQNKGVAGPLKVGCSKASCYYCGFFARRFNEWAGRQSQVNQIVTSGYHGKYVNTWLMPTCPPEVEAQILDHVGNLVYDVFNSVTGPKRKSDSRSLSSTMYGQSPGDESLDEAGSEYEI